MVDVAGYKRSSQSIRSIILASTSAKKKIVRFYIEICDYQK